MCDTDGCAPFNGKVEFDSEGRLWVAARCYQSPSDPPCDICQEPAPATSHLVPCPSDARFLCVPTRTPVSFDLCCNQDLRTGCDKTCITPEATRTPTARTCDETCKAEVASGAVQQCQCWNYTFPQPTPTSGRKGPLFVYLGGQKQCADNESFTNLGKVPPEELICATITPGPPPTPGPTTCAHGHVVPCSSLGAPIVAEAMCEVCDDGRTIIGSWMPSATPDIPRTIVAELRAIREALSTPTRDRGCMTGRRKEPYGNEADQLPDCTPLPNEVRCLTNPAGELSCYDDTNRRWMFWYNTATPTAPR